MTQQAQTAGSGGVDPVRQLFERVKSMRNAQRMYFKHRELNWLQESKRLESEVDYLLKKVEERGQI